MRRRRTTSRKPAKARQATKAKRGAASEPARNRRVPALTEDTEVARLARELAEARDQQAATSQVLQVISSSPGELEPVFQTVLENATRICEAGFGVLALFDGHDLRHAASYNPPHSLVERCDHRRQFRVTQLYGGPSKRNRWCISQTSPQ